MSFSVLQRKVQECTSVARRWVRKAMVDFGMKELSRSKWIRGISMRTAADTL